MSTLLQVSWRVCQWKNFENRSVFCEVMTKTRCHAAGTYLTHGVKMKESLTSLSVSSPCLCCAVVLCLIVCCFTVLSVCLCVLRYSSREAICLFYIQLKLISACHSPLLSVMMCGSLTQASCVDNNQQSMKADFFSSFSGLCILIAVVFIGMLLVFFV